ncbi:ankyrin repeat-containing domain protein [Microdochium trichocladiopsis]|uniref:Ankyrin repeat-containing domain protein n=1 Tax=Microdochium trichocladiopsis TaxID=1682393 RepID=A0A9P9BHP9_9PEZI|nr:ankyrin repeat-containing domain protein [Microdochium trichocladiopsis]KAH7012136.1 ankyrin repeat-containing domain protein [Microdochium trichocladiopsis]
MDTNARSVGPSCLLTRLPVELLLCVLGNLDAKSLCRVERVSTGMRDVAQIAFRIIYGPEIHHRAAPSPVSFRDLAIEEYKLNLKPFQNVQFIAFLVANLYWRAFSPEEEERQHNKSYATEFLLSLRRTDFKESAAWLEAVSLALMIQGRVEEAELYIHRLEAIGPLPENAFYVQARYGTCQGYTAALKRFSSVPTAEMLGKSCIGAAIRGDIELLAYLFANGAAGMRYVMRGHSIASAAAYAGHTVVLQFLHGRGVDITSPGLWTAPIVAAVFGGHLDTVRYLLEKGAPTIIHRRLLAEYAIHLGRLDLLRLIAQHSHLPAIGPNGVPVIAYALRSKNREARAEIVEYLVQEARLDINALSYHGTVLHIALRFGTVETIAQLVHLGADIHATDYEGQSALQYAYAQSRSVAAWLTQKYEATAWRGYKGRGR